MSGYPTLDAAARPIRTLRTQRATRIRRLLGSIGLMPLAFRLWRTARDWSPKRMANDYRLRRNASEPIPPARLLFVTSATSDVDWFFKSGEATRGAFTEALEGMGRPMESFRSVLDFGCGCGRMLRQWRDVEGPRFFGTDYNAQLVNWCSANLDHAMVGRNALTPPLSYDDGAFDLCYSVSVFTHLTEKVQEAWLRELHRVIEPGGILLATLSGEGDLGRTTPSEQDRFHAGELVVIDGSLAGTNLCGAYHPEPYVRRYWAPYFEVLEFIPEGAKGCPNQDLYVLERSGDQPVRSDAITSVDFIVYPADEEADSVSSQPSM